MLRWNSRNSARSPRPRWSPEGIAGSALSVLLAGVLSVSVGSDVQAQEPRRIVSTNLCTDQFVLALADRDQIAGVSRAGQDPFYSPLSELAKGLPAHRGGAEEIVMMRPDLVVAGAYTRADTVHLLDRLSVPVLNVPAATRIQDLFPQIRQVADVLGHPDRGAELSRALRQRYRAFTVPEERGTGVLYRPGGYALGRDTIADDVLRAVGIGNIGSDLGIKGEDRLALEQLILSPPDFLILASQRPERPSLGRRLLQHPALKKMPTSVDTVWFPARYWLCATPASVEGAETLAAAITEKLNDRNGLSNQ